MTTIVRLMTTIVRRVRSSDGRGLTARSGHVRRGRGTESRPGCLGYACLRLLEGRCIPRVFGVCVFRVCGMRHPGTWGRACGAVSCLAFGVYHLGGACTHRPDVTHRPVEVTPALQSQRLFAGALEFAHDVW